MICADTLFLQRFIDSDLDGEHAEIVAAHLESCGSCRADAQTIIELRTFVQDRLGVEDEGEDERARLTLSSISTRLPIATAKMPPRWRGRWIAAAVIAVAILLVPIPLVPTLEAWPKQILERAVAQERTWRSQPNKIFHWQVDTVSTGIRGVSDGRRRTRFWRKNSETTFSEICRQVREDGSTEFAYWRRTDGSSILYRGATGVLEITPTSDALRRSLPEVAGELRDILQSQLSERALNRSLDVDNRRDVEWLHGRSMRIAGGTTTFDGIGGAFGEVRQIRVVKDRPQSNPSISRAVHEYDIDAATLRLLRLRTTITYADGTTGVQDSRWTVFRETSDAEYEAQTADDLVAAGARVKRLTPIEYARQRLQEKTPAPTN